MISGKVLNFHFLSTLRYSWTVRTDCLPPIRPSAPSLPALLLPVPLSREHDFHLDQNWSTLVETAFSTFKLPKVDERSWQRLFSCKKSVAISPGFFSLPSCFHFSRDTASIHWAFSSRIRSGFSLLRSEADSILK